MKIANVVVAERLPISGFPLEIIVLTVHTVS